MSNIKHHIKRAQKGNSVTVARQEPDAHLPSLPLLSHKQSVTALSDWPIGPSLISALQVSGHS